MGETLDKDGTSGKSTIGRKLLIALGVIVLLLAVFAVVVAMQPSEFEVTRTGTINAPPAVVFDHVNNLSKWQAWSPWDERDPNAKNTFEGPEAGKGAIFHWDGNDDVGAGSMTITDSRPPEQIDIDLAFIRPFEDRCDVQFTFKPQGEQNDKTLVTWDMHGKNNFIAKAMCMFMDMDKMVGGDFEQGLANLNKVVEAAPHAEHDELQDDDQSDNSTDTQDENKE